MNSRKLELARALGLALGIGLWAASAPAQPVESTACADCHEDQVAAFVNNPHHVLDSEAWKGTAPAGSCVSCHAGAEHHIEEGGGAGTIFAFSDAETAKARTEVCLTCHGDQHSRFSATSHAGAGLTCTSCHDMHQEGRPSLALVRATTDRSPRAKELGPGSRACVECHDDVRAQFDFNERHRLQEGILDCTSCHSPHEPQTRVALGGFKQEQCIDCHTDKGGPFVFEHGSVKAEGCTSCHTPHGSPNRHLLMYQNVAEACFGCHGLVPGFHSRFTLETNCTNCHSSIHGSNFDKFFLK